MNTLVTLHDLALARGCPTRRARATLALVALQIGPIEVGFFRSPTDLQNRLFLSLNQRDTTFRIAVADR